MKDENHQTSTHDRILNAAMQVFSRKGFRGATTRAIAQEAGVNEVTLFRHFGSKKQLFMELIRKYSVIPYIEAVRAKKNISVEKRIQELVDRIMEILLQRHHLIAILLSEGPKRDEQSQMIFEAGPLQVLRYLSQWFADVREAGEIRDLIPEGIARAVMGMFFTYIVFQKIFPGENLSPIDSEKIKRTFVEILLHGILPSKEK